MLHRQKINALLIIISSLLISGLGVTSVAAFDSEPKTSTPIHHIIVVMQQNHTFDNYFGTYPGANGSAADTCIPVSLSDVADASCIAPFHIDAYHRSDLSHGTRIFEGQYNDGQMNGFVDALYNRNQDGKLAMAYFDDNDIPYYWNLADEFVLFDHYFSSAHTGSVMNRMFWVSGKPGSEYDFIPKDGFGDIPTIFDRLQARDISWKFYVNHYDPSLNYRSLKKLRYLPPQIQWVPLLGFDRFLDNPELSSRIVDLREYYTDLQNGTLPAVSYVLLLGASERPLADLTLGQTAVRTMIQMLMASNAWDSSAFMITYDNWGGWYDHVPPPQVDKYGYGFRVPALLVSPYARKGYIDHTQLDHTSILKFIETNWDIPALAERDARASNITSAFNFSSPPREPVFISSIRKIPEPRFQPRRIVIYLAYGSAMILATLVLLPATAKARKLENINNGKVKALNSTNHTEGQRDKSRLIPETETLRSSAPLALPKQTEVSPTQSADVTEPDISGVMLGTLSDDRRDHIVHNVITLTCPVCYSPNIVKNGRNRHGQQKYRCKACGACRTIKSGYAISQRDLS
jgi:phospholipase C